MDLSHIVIAPSSMIKAAHVPWSAKDVTTMNKKHYSIYNALNSKAK